MPQQKKPVEVFISYSHRDRKHLDKFRVHLAGLERSAQIHCWWDGALEVGKNWEPQLVDALRRADVVVLLLTANFIASYYCIDKELQLARERERQGQIDLIPVLVESVEFGSHWLGQLQMITVNGKSIIQSRLGSEAWATAAREIRLKIECIQGRRPVMQALNEVEEVVKSGDVRLSDLSTDRQAQINRFPTVSAFWKAKSTLLEELDLVTVQGTLSQFAPMLMGPPRAKRRLHLEFRKAIETDRRFGERKRLTINACMSISAGQMVHREVRKENRKRLLGLYESIVRNSIPVFVLPEYYRRELLPVFQETPGSGCFEANVTGRLFLLDNNYIRRFLAKQGIIKILPPFVIDSLCQDAYALEVGGPGTTIQKLVDQPIRYLDGDIWLAVKSDVNEYFITTFVDIANEAEREEEIHRLQKEAQGNQIIAAYNKLRSISQLITEDDM